LDCAGRSEARGLCRLLRSLATGQGRLLALKTCGCQALLAKKRLDTCRI